MKVLQTAKCSKLPVESDWICKTSQNVQFLGFLETEMGFWKMVFKLKKCAKFGKFAVECDRYSKSSQNVLKSIFLEKLHDVFQKKTWILQHR